MAFFQLSGAVTRNYGRTWRHRRRIIYGTLVFCAVSITYLLWKGGDDQVHGTIATSAFLLGGAVIGSYVFGAVWDDKNIRAEVTTATVAERVSTSEPATGGSAEVDDPDKPV